MTRRLRKDQRNGFFHTMVRGNNKQAIFHDTKDYIKAIEFLSDASQKYQCKIHLFCLMTNHIHLLVETSEIPLARFMQSVLSRYTKWFNHAHEKIGHLFQGRYKAKKVINRAYFCELIYYIHDNPIKAGLVNTMSDYRWSSHHSYCGREHFTWVTTNYIQSLLSEQYDSYTSFIEQFKQHTEISKYCSFDLEATLSIKYDELDTSDETLYLLDSLSFNEICEVISESLNLDKQLLSSISQSTKACLLRAVVCYFAHFSAKIPLKFLGIQLERCPDQLSRNMYKFLNTANYHQTFNQAKLSLVKAIASKKLFGADNELCK